MVSETVDAEAVCQPVSVFCHKSVRSMAASS